MNTDEINRAIAEHLGWRLIQCRDDGFGRAASERWRDPDGDIGPCPPIYTHDLNAMHEAEKVILQNADTGYDYDCNMNAVCETWEDGVMNYMKLWHATAHQRAEAFLRTIGKWRDS